MSAALVPEPIREAALRADRQASDSCTRTPASCAWYHGLYPLLRLLGLAATPERHAAFYDEAFSHAARAGKVRVGVTGAADSCMLAHVLRAYATADVALVATVVDRCQTPLDLCRAYATLAGIDIETEVADMLTWRPGRRFDVLTTHAFIGMFPHDKQPALLQTWAAALRPGGVLISVARVDADWTPDVPGFSDAQAAAFRALVERRVVEAGLPDVIDRSILAVRVAEYGRRMRSFPFASEAALVELLETAGFRIERLELQRFEGRAGVRESGPGAHRPGTFAHFVACVRE